jgi:hypothetical protein
MNTEFSEDDLKLLEMLLSKEEGQTLIEIHRCHYHEYKHYLRERHNQISEMLERVRSTLAVACR